MSDNILIFILNLNRDSESFGSLYCCVQPTSILPLWKSSASEEPYLLHRVVLTSSEQLKKCRYFIYAL